MNINEANELIEKLYTEYPKMVKVLIRDGVPELLVDDLIQSVFEDAVRKADKLIDHPNPVGWLYIALSIAVKVEMRQPHRSDISLSSLENVLATREDTYFNASIEPYLPKNMRKKDKEFLLHAIDDDWSYKQLSQYYNIREDACRKRFSRLIAALREDMLTS